MSGAEITSLILGTIGAVTGTYATWLSHKATRQELTLSRTDMKLLRFRVTNHSLRPIPVQAVTLQLRDGSCFVPSTESPTIEGIALPGVLAPESCFTIQWAGTRQVIELIYHGEFILSVTTQTGRTFSLVGKAEGLRQLSPACNGAANPEQQVGSLRQDRREETTKE
jgi:hypothetical protein